ncbi:MAG TPA: hypothetical protein VI037_00120 [Nitrososphaera sp.]
MRDIQQLRKKGHRTIEESAQASGRKRSHIHSYQLDNSSDTDYHARSTAVDRSLQTTGTLSGFL